MECPNCHHWNEAGARFCEECGFDLTSVVSGPAKVSITGGVTPPDAPVLPWDAPQAPPPMPWDVPEAPPASPAVPPPIVPDAVPVVPINVAGSPAAVTNPAAVAPAPGSMPYAGPRLILDASGTIFKLGDTTLVGRENPDVQIDFDGYPDGQYISHRHAQITKHDTAYYIEDLGSSNHTRVNGAKISVGQAQPLKDGDKIRFGKIELTFHEV